MRKFLPLILVCLIFFLTACTIRKAADPNKEAAGNSVVQSVPESASSTSTAPSEEGESTTAAIEYAIKYCEGKTDGKADLEVMRDCFKKGMEQYDAADIGFEVKQHPDYENYFLFTEDYIVF